MNGTPDATAITIAIIRMGKSLNLRVIAEGVESAEDLAFLRRHDCDEAQGFYFSEPVPAEQFADILRKRPFYGVPVPKQSTRSAHALSTKAS